MRNPVAQGSWEIVAQLAIQKLDELCLDGADTVLGLLVRAASGEARLPARTNMLSFAARNLDSLYTKPSTQRRLVTAAMDLALITLPTTGAIRSSREYFDWMAQVVESEGDRSDRYTDRPVDPRDLWQPLLTLLQNSDERGELVIDQLLSHACDRLDDEPQETAAAAFVFLMLRKSLKPLARIPSESFDEELAIEVPPVLWNMKQIERKLGGPLRRDRILRWGETNFWAAVLAHREHLITMTDLVRSTGVATLACAADPFLGLGVSIDEDKSPMAELLLVYLGSARPEDGCRLNEKETRRTLALVGRELDQGVPKFDPEWLPETPLYQRVVRRDFLSSTARDTTTPTSADALSDQDATFGAAVLLAALIEMEEWDIIDYSEDQLGVLALGPLQVLEPVFVARRTEGFWGTEVDDALRRSGLSATRKKVLTEWAGHRTNFTLA